MTNVHAQFYVLNIDIGVDGKGRSKASTVDTVRDDIISAKFPHAYVGFIVGRMLCLPGFCQTHSSMCIDDAKAHVIVK